MTAVQIDDYLMDIPADFQKYILQLHSYLSAEGCKVKLQQAKSGHVVSYTHPQNKKVVANFVSRKAGPFIRVYADHSGMYGDFFDAMPEELEALVAKAPACKRMLDPAKCNSRCAMGYDIRVRGSQHQKCRFNCFLFPVNGDTLSFISALLEQELLGRAAAGC